MVDACLARRARAAIDHAIAGRHGVWRDGQRLGDKGGARIRGAVERSVRQHGIHVGRQPYSVCVQGPAFEILAQRAPAGIRLAAERRRGTSDSELYAGERARRSPTQRKKRGQTKSVSYPRLVHEAGSTATSVLSPAAQRVDAICAAISQTPSLASQRAAGPGRQGCPSRWSLRAPVPPVAQRGSRPRRDLAVLRWAGFLLQNLSLMRRTALFILTMAVVAGLGCGGRENGATAESSGSESRSEAGALGIADASGDADSADSPSEAGTFACGEAFCDASQICLTPAYGWVATAAAAWS
jgi:hypothetical protein